MKLEKTMLSILLFFIIIAYSVNALGFGVSPSNIEISNAFKGKTYESVIGIFNSGSSSSNFVLNVSGDGSDWISFYKENKPNESVKNITISGNKNARLTVKFSIPQETPNGNYSPTIYVSMMPQDSTTEGSSSSISIQIPVETLITVTGEQSLSGVVNSITTSNTEIDRPLRIKVEFQNTGNVIATPTIKATIVKDNLTIDNVVYSEKSFPVNSKDVAVVDWNTTGQALGDYTVNVKVFLGNDMISEKYLNFKILEKGSLTIQGTIKSVVAPQQVTIGELAKIEVEFMNTGKIDLNTKITGEVFNNNNEFVSVINSDDVLVTAGKTETLTLYFRPTENGKYLIKGNVVYEGEKEPMNDIFIDVGDQIARTNVGNPISGMFVLDTKSLVMIVFVIFALGLIIMGIFSKKFKKSIKRK
jgi:hypothetical protein